MAHHVVLDGTKHLVCDSPGVHRLSSTSLSVEKWSETAVVAMLVGVATCSGTAENWQPCALPWNSPLSVPALFSCHYIGSAGTASSGRLFAHPLTDPQTSSTAVVLECPLPLFDGFVAAAAYEGTGAATMQLQVQHDGLPLPFKGVPLGDVISFTNLPISPPLSPPPLDPYPHSPPSAPSLPPSSPPAECLSMTVCSSWYFPPRQKTHVFLLRGLVLPLAWSIEGWVQRVSCASSWCGNMFSLAVPGNDNCALLSVSQLPDEEWHHIALDSAGKI